MGNIYRPRVVAEGLNIGIVVSRFNELVTEQLLNGAIDTLERHSTGEEECDYDVYYVPGSFELPAVARRLAASGRYDGVLALGTLLHGDTDHYELKLTDRDVLEAIPQVLDHLGEPGRDLLGNRQIVDLLVARVRVAHDLRIEILETGKDPRGPSGKGGEVVTEIPQCGGGGNPGRIVISRGGGFQA